MFTTILLYAGLIPLAIAFLVALAVWRVGASPPVVWACGVGLGFIAAQIGLKNQLGLIAAIRGFVVPREPADWLPMIVVLAIGASLLLTVASRSYRHHAIALAALLVIVVPVRLLSGNVRVTQIWSPLEKIVYLALLAATIGLVWLVLASGNDERPSLTRLVLLVVVTIGSALVLTLSGVLVYGQSTGAVAAAIAGTALACLPVITRSNNSVYRLPFVGLRGAAGVIALALGSLIILGHFTAGLTITNAALLLVSLVAAGAPTPKAIASQPPWLQLVFRTLVCLTPLAIAIGSVAE
jgi:hypothetical protein